MRTLSFGVPADIRSKVRTILSDNNLEGTRWLKCDINYRKRQFVLPFLLIAISLITWSLPADYDAIPWIVAITIVTALSVLYLIALLAWSLSVSGIRYVICDDLLIERKNWLFGLYPIGKFRQITLQETQSIVLTEGKILIGRRRLSFRFPSPMKYKLNTFASTLAQQSQQNARIAQSSAESALNSLRRTRLSTFLTIVGMCIAMALSIQPIVSTVAVRIDRTNWVTAKLRATATAFREYLSEARNVLYRADAHKAIFSLYDTYIARTDKSPGDTTSLHALHDILVFLRDHDQTSVLLLFSSANQLRDLGSNELSIRPIAQVFDDTNRRQLETRILSSVSKGFASVFPADILAVSGFPQQTNVPIIRVSYVYSNSDSIYYNENQKNLPLEKRDLYYGLKISWTITATIPDHKPVLLAQLQSEPPPEFSVTEGSSDAGIYQTMATTAFDDLANKLAKQFGLT